MLKSDYKVGDVVRYIGNRSGYEKDLAPEIGCLGDVIGTRGRTHNTQIRWRVSPGTLRVGVYREDGWWYMDTDIAPARYVAGF